MGLVLAGLFTCTELGIKGAMVVVISHGLTSPALFNFANIVYERRFSRRIVLCKGLISIFPALSMSLFLACGANIAVPCSINLVGEIWLAIRVIGFSFFFMLFIGLICFLVGGYTLYIYTRICHGRVSRFFNFGHLFSRCAHLIILIQLWPLFFFMVALPIIL